MGFSIKVLVEVNNPVYGRKIIEIEQKFFTYFSEADFVVTVFVNFFDHRFQVQVGLGGT